MGDRGQIRSIGYQESAQGEGGAVRQEHRRSRYNGSECQNRIECQISTKYLTQLFEKLAKTLYKKFNSSDAFKELVQPMLGD